ncbi:MAG: hypothetical protein LBI15_00355 [Dysgonamonadaceae bacterium]|jgi:hypothetical protein|nr:hypothetical protein [Dysgonamonadaceae bacterium]
MKKLILFLGVIGVVTLMTSCINGDNSYTDQAFAYIDFSENHTIHGRTSSFRAPLITSNGMRGGMIGQTSINWGEFYFFAFSWEEANGTTELGENRRADNVNVSSVIEIPRTSLRMSHPAPEIPEGTTPPLFRAIGTPQFAGDSFYWNDHWMFEFGYTGGEIPPTVVFYKREISEGNNANSNSTNIDIDIRIESPASSGTQPRGHAVAVNMSQLRTEFQQPNSDHTLNIRFHFYREGQTAIHTSEPVRWVLTRTSTSGQ